MFTSSQAAKYLQISLTTLRRWDKQQKLCPIRTFGHHRRYLKDQLDAFLGISLETPHQSAASAIRIPYLYARVSTVKQDRDGNLRRQADRLKQYIISRFGTKQPYVLIQEYGSGLNAKRRGIQRLIHAVINQKVSMVIVEFPDRLTRFGLPFLQTLFNLYSVPIIATIPRSTVRIEDQLLEDMMMLIASFSGKYYQKRTFDRQHPNPQQYESDKIDKIIAEYLNKTLTKAIARAIASVH